MRLIRLGVPVLVVVALAACGDSASISPAGPSSIGAGSGAVISGRVTGIAALTAPAEPAATTLDARAADSASGSITVTVVGTGTSTTVGPGGTFTLTGVPSGSVQLLFSGKGANGTITLSGVESTDRIEISVNLTGGSPRVESENRHKENGSNNNGNNGVLVNGRVSAVSVAANTLQVEGTLVTIVPTTVIRHGSTTLALSKVVVGDHVEVKGTRTAIGVTASEINVESNDEDDDDDEEDQNTRELSGTLSALQGQCPVLTFTVKSTKVVTNAQTAFKDVTCAALANGTSVDVTGMMTGTTLVATRVERD